VTLNKVNNITTRVIVQT